MPTQPPRHRQLVRFFAGEYGENLYNQALLAGPTGKVRVEMLSYMALYPDLDLPYVTLVPRGAPNLRQAANKILSLRFPEETSAVESRQARIAVVGSPADVDETIWELGVRKVSPYGLPVLFVTWMRIVANNNQKIILWYPSITQGRWALARFQNSLRQHRGH